MIDFAVGCMTSHPLLSVAFLSLVGAAIGVGYVKHMHELRDDGYPRW